LASSGTIIWVKTQEVVALKRFIIFGIILFLAVFWKIFPGISGKTKEKWFPFYLYRGDAV